MKTLVTTALVVAAFCIACGSSSESEPAWAPAFDATSTGWLLNVWGPSADELYAVGGTPDRGRIVRFDGQAWTEMSVGIDVPLLNWAYGFGAQNVWVVGNGGTILRYDGQWTRTPTITDQDLWGVWGAGPDDIWAVGGTVSPSGEATILRYDGQAWRRVDVPELSRSGVDAFFKVWGTGPNNVYVVGRRGGVLRWDGQTLREELVGTSRDLIALWGTGPDRIVIVGGRANGEVVTWNGVEWRNTVLGARPGLNGVWMRRPEVAHLVGGNGSILRFDFDTEAVEDDRPEGVELDFHAIFGVEAAGRMVTVGGNFSFADGPYEGVAYDRELSSDD